MKRVVSLLLLWLMVSCAASLAQRNDFPVVVARVKFAGQTNAVPQRVIFTPKSTGLFRIAGVLMVTTAGGNGSWNARLAWHDVQDQDTFFDEIDSNEIRTNWTSFVFTAQQGTPVKFEVEPANDVSGSVYDAFFVIERLTKIPSF